MIGFEKARRVNRVVVMLEYADGSPGDVFDLTQLALELAQAPNAAHQQALIELSVSANPDYSQQSSGGVWPLRAEAAWQVMIGFEKTSRSGHLDDAVNASMPDSLTTENMRKRQKRARKLMEKLEEEIKVQRLMDASAVRSQRPVARIAPGLLTKALAGIGEGSHEDAKARSGTGAGPAEAGTPCGGMAVV